MRYIKVGFITKRKHGILLQINDGGAHTSDFRYISLEINNSGKHAYLNPVYSDGYPHTDITNKDRIVHYIYLKPLKTQPVHVLFFP